MPYIPAGYLNLPAIMRQVIPYPVAIGIPACPQPAEITIGNECGNIFTAPVHSGPQNRGNNAVTEYRAIFRLHMNSIGWRTVIKFEESMGGSNIFIPEYSGVTEG